MSVQPFSLGGMPEVSEPLQNRERDDVPPRAVRSVVMGADSMTTDGTSMMPRILLTCEALDRDALVRTDPAALEQLWRQPDARVTTVWGNEVEVNRAGASVGSQPGPEQDVQPTSAAEQQPDCESSGISLRWLSACSVSSQRPHDAVYLGRVQECDEAEPDNVRPGAMPVGSPLFAVLKPSRESEPAQGAPSSPNTCARQAASSGMSSAVSTATLREIGEQLNAVDSACATTAVALANWHARHTHCPVCGAATGMDEAGWVRRCEADDSVHFPRTDPAVIMAIVDEEERILLARGKRWGGPRRSVLAGFVEPGESFEQAVARETLEESGIRVHDIVYRGSQPWPFPASVMVGFTARADSGQRLRPQEGEIEALAWYSRADLRAALGAGELTLPGRISIARALIEDWYGEPLTDPDRW